MRCFAALTDRRRPVPVAVAISVPFLWWNVLAILVACIPLARQDRPRPVLGIARVTG